MYKTIQVFFGFFAILAMARIAYAQQFPDVRGTPYEQAFAYLSSKGAVNGYSDGYGLPDYYLNRAEALKVVAALKVPSRVQYFRENPVPMPLFSDISAGAWYSPYVEAGFEASMLTGYPDRTFRPARYLTVEEAVTMAVRAYGLSGGAGGALLSSYIQNRDGEWFTPYINSAVSKNLIMHQGRLELGGIITRGRFFDILYRLENLKNSSSAVYAGPEPAITSVSLLAASPGSAGGGVISVAQPQSSVMPQFASEKYFAISMPTLGVNDLTVTHPADPFTPDGVLIPLKIGVGHLFGYPGGGGKILIYGHSSSYPWDVSNYTKIFRQVNKLNVADRVYVTYDGKLYTYEVTEKVVVDANDTSHYQDDGRGEDLILYTCWPPDSIKQRYLVHAVPVSVVALR